MASEPLAGQRKDGQAPAWSSWHVSCGFSCPLTGEGAAMPGSARRQDPAGERRLREI